MDNLSSNVANLNVGEHNTKKKKPARAFHQFAQPQPNGQFQAPISSPLGTPLGAPGTPQSYSQQSMTGSPLPMNMGTPLGQQTPGQSTNDVMGNPTVDLATQRLLDQKEYLNKTFDTSRDSILPLKTTQFYSVDTGSCDPRLMGLSMYNVPKNETLRNITKLPMGVHIQPFAPITTITKSSEAVSSPNADDGGPAEGGDDEDDEDGLYMNEISTRVGTLRCRRCRAYNNHNFQFSADGSTFVCNFCNTKTSVSSIQDQSNEYQMYESNILPAANAGVLDFKAPPEYNHVPNEESAPLHYCFLVDISSFANGNKSSISCIDAVQTSIEYIAKKQPFCKIGIIGFDKNLHFFKLNKNLETAQEYIVGDLYGDTRMSGNEEGSVFLPFYDGMFVSPEESMHIIEDTLNKLKDFCANTNTGYVKQEMDVCFGPALETAMLALKTFAKGGKILCSLNSLPKYSRGSLQLRKDDTFKKNLKFGDQEYYKKLGKQLLQNNCGVDLFVTTDGFIDVCNVGFPSLITNGQIKYYPHFQSVKDDFQICSDYLSSVASTIGYQGTIKLRCSSGLSIDTYYKESCNYSSYDPALPILTKETNVSILLKYDGESLDKNHPLFPKETFFQSALLYTNLLGERRIRILNTSGAIESNLFEIYKFVDQENVANIIIKDIILTLFNNQATDYEVVRKTIDNKLCEVFTQYRAVTNNHNMNVMVLPESLKLLPTFMLAFESSKLMKQTKQSTRSNERVIQAFEFLTLPLSKLFYKMYPQIIPLHTSMDQENDLVLYDLNLKLLSIKTVGNFAVSNSVKKLVDGGCYLIFNGEGVYLWYNQNTNPLLLKDLLGYDYQQQQQQQQQQQPNGMAVPCLEIECGLFPKVDSDINVKVSNLLRYWKKLCYFHNYIKVTPLSPMNYMNNNMEFSSILTHEIFFDDKNMENIETLETYLLILHKNIKEKLEKQDYITISKKDQQKEHAFQSWYSQT